MLEESLVFRMVDLVQYLEANAGPDKLPLSMRRDFVSARWQDALDDWASARAILENRLQRLTRRMYVIEDHQSKTALYRSYQNLRTQITDLIAVGNDSEEQIRATLKDLVKPSLHP